MLYLDMDDFSVYSPVRVGARLRAIRAHFGLSQSQFCKRVGCTVGALSNWENGRQRPEPEVQQDIIDTFDLTLDWLILGRGDERLAVYRKLAVKEAQISGS